MCLLPPQTPVAGTLVSARPPTWLVLPAQAPESVQEPQNRPLAREPGLTRRWQDVPVPTVSRGLGAFPAARLCPLPWELVRFRCHSSRFLKTVSAGPAPRPPPSPSQFGGEVALMQREHRGTPAGYGSRPGLVIPTSPSASWAVTQSQDLRSLSPSLHCFVVRSR